MDIRNSQSLMKTTHAAQPYCPSTGSLGMSPAALRNNKTHPMSKDLTSLVSSLCERSCRSKSEPFVFAQPSMQASVWSQAQVLLSAPGDAEGAVPLHRLAKEQPRSCSCKQEPPRACPQPSPLMGTSASQESMSARGIRAMWKVGCNLVPFCTIYLSHVWNFFCLSEIL